MANRTLFVQNLPEQLQEHEKKEFLEHFGAIEVRLMSNIGRMKNSAFVTFQDSELAKTSFERLKNVTIFGNVLKVQYANEEKQKNIESMRIDSNKLEPLAPQFGLDYPRPPNLTYVYPPPTQEILKNICNAIISVPKLYTQVLHLMNKMNLPPPFQVQKTPSLISQLPVEEEILKEENNKKRTHDDLVASDESELSSDEDLNKKVKLKKLNPLIYQQRQQPTQPFFDTSLPFTQILPPVVDFKENSFQNIRKVEEKEEEEEELSKEESEDFNFITFEEINSKKLTIQQTKIIYKEIQEIPSFKNYQQGEENEILYIKNLAKGVQESDLIYIFSRYFNSKKEVEEQLDLKLMKEGRLKGQCFANFHSIKKAKKALEEVNGYILQERPMVIQFAKGEKPKV